MKSGSRQPVAEIESRPAQIICALVVDEKLDAIALDHGIAGFFFVERHFVVQARATALGDLHTQTSTGVLLLFIKKGAQLSCRVLGNVNHSTANYDLARLSQKTEVEKMLRG